MPDYRAVDLIDFFTSGADQFVRLALNDGRKPTVEEVMTELHRVAWARAFLKQFEELRPMIESTVSHTIERLTRRPRTRELRLLYLYEDGKLIGRATGIRIEGQTVFLEGTNADLERSLGTDERRVVEIYICDTTKHTWTRIPAPAPRTIHSWHAAMVLEAGGPIELNVKPPHHE